MKNKKKCKVLVAMSGGVDSSVAASILVEENYEVIGISLLMNEVFTGNNQTSIAEERFDDARLVADKLEIPFYLIDCREEFKRHVIKPFVNDYLQGKTPNPCVFCNTNIKFSYLIKKMKDFGCNYLATGHYAQIKKNSSDKYELWKGEDLTKDQSYFLFNLPYNILSKIIFPVGGKTKQEIRYYAKEKKIMVATKKDSTGICFIDKKSNYEDFINMFYSQNIEKTTEEKKTINFINKEGDIKLYPNGKILGKHKGIHSFTYGQRKGLGISYNNSLYVIKIDNLDNTVWLGEEKLLYSKEFYLAKTNWLEEISDKEIFTVKIRYLHKGDLAEIIKIKNDKQDLKKNGCYNDDGDDNNFKRDRQINCQSQKIEYKITFYEPQRAITPGQIAVCYKENRLIGGGFIVL